MSCDKCKDYKLLYLCLACGKLLHPIYQNIRSYHDRLEKIVNPIN